MEPKCCFGFFSANKSIKTGIFFCLFYPPKPYGAGFDGRKNVQFISFEKQKKNNGITEKVLAKINMTMMMMMADNLWAIDWECSWFWTIFFVARFSLEKWCPTLPTNLDNHHHHEVKSKQWPKPNLVCKNLFLLSNFQNSNHFLPEENYLFGQVNWKIQNQTND